MLRPGSSSSMQARFLATCAASVVLVVYWLLISFMYRDHLYVSMIQGATAVKYETKLEARQWQEHIKLSHGMHFFPYNLF